MMVRNMFRKWAGIILRSLNGCTASTESIGEPHIPYVDRSCSTSANFLPMQWSEGFQNPSNCSTFGCRACAVILEGCCPHS